MAVNERELGSSTSKLDLSIKSDSSRMKHGRSRSMSVSAYETIKRTVTQVEDRFEQNIINKVFSDQIMSDAELMAKRIFRAVGNTMKTASEQNICDGEMSVITDAQTHMGTIGTNSIYNGASRISSMSVTDASFARNQMMDEAHDRRSQISTYIQTNTHKNSSSTRARKVIEEHGTFNRGGSCIPTLVSARNSPTKNRRLPGTDVHDAMIPAYITSAKPNETQVELNQLKSELKSAFASFVKLEADKIAIKEFYGKEIRLISREMKNAEKLYVKEKSAYEETIKEQKTKMSKLKDDLSRLKVKLMATSNISTLTEDTQQLTLENEKMAEELASSSFQLKDMQLKLIEKNEIIEKKNNEVESLVKQVKMSKIALETNKELANSISELKRNYKEKEKEMQALKEEFSTKDLHHLEAVESFSTVKRLVKSLTKEIQILTTENNALYSKIRMEKMVDHKPESPTSSSIEQCLRTSIAVHKEVEDEIEGLQHNLLMRKKGEDGDSSHLSLPNDIPSCRNSTDDSTISTSVCSRSFISNASITSNGTFNKREKPGVKFTPSTLRKSPSKGSTRSSASSFSSSTFSNINASANNIGMIETRDLISKTKNLSTSSASSISNSVYQETRDEVPIPSFDESAPSFDEGKARETKKDDISTDNWVSFGQVDTMFG